jgi:linoleoyl-CoA desaturase
MHFTCGIILSIVFQLAHTVEETEFPLPDTTGSMEDSWAVHQLRTTMNFATKNKWLSWYVGGLNFQVEHHLFMRICHVHYPAIAPIVKQTAQEFGVPYLEKRTFSSAFLSHIRHLKKLGRTPLDEIMG